MPHRSKPIRRLVFSIGFFGIGTPYLALVVYLWGTQEQAIFKPMESIPQTPADLDPPLSFESVEIPCGESAIHAFWLPADDHAPAALYLHGQDATIGKNLEHAQCLNQLGCHVLVIDYRGFGATFGSLIPSESSVYDDAETAWDHLTTGRGFPPERILIYGHSLGGAIAIELATRHPDAGGLVTEGTFTSAAQMARWKSPVTRLMPLRLLLRHRFDSVGKVRDKAIPPVLFVHGTSDEKVPHFMCQQLYDATAGTRKEMILIEGGGHARRGSGQAAYRAKMAEWIERTFPPP